MGQDLLTAQHQRRPRYPPTHRVEHWHYSTNSICGRKRHRIGHTLGHSVQILRSVLILHALGIACCTTGITQAKWRIFIQLRPTVIGRVIRDKFLIINRIRQISIPILVAFFRRHDDSLNTGNSVLKRFEKWERISIDDDHLILRVANDVFQISIR